MHGILHTSARLYGSYHLRRVYYSAFSPIPDSSSALPLKKPPLMREHRLYQADWLMRFYGFAQPRDPRRHGRRHARSRNRSEARLGAAQPRRFSRSTSTAPTARRCCACRGSARRRSDRILQTRRYRRLRLEDVGRLCASIAKVRPFIVAEGWSPGELDRPGRPARENRPLLRTAGAVLTMQNCTRPFGPYRSARRRDRFRRLARRARAAGAERACRRMRSSWRVGRGRAPTCRLRGHLPRRGATLNVPRDFVERAGDRRSATPIPSVSRCSTACCGGCAPSRTCSRSRPTPTSAASRRWKSRCAATCTRCAPSCASAGRRRRRRALCRLVRARPFHRRAQRGLLRAPLHRHALDDPDAACLGVLGRRKAADRPRRVASRMLPPKTPPRSSGAPISRTSSTRRG